jgi:hypothetical protein
MIGKFLINLGVWFNKHFPEKMSADEVYSKIAAIELRLHDVSVLHQNVLELQATNVQTGELLATLSKKVEALTTENAALKAQSALRMRVASSIPMPGR